MNKQAKYQRTAQQASLNKEKTSMKKTQKPDRILPNNSKINQLPIYPIQDSLEFIHGLSLNNSAIANRFQEEDFDNYNPDQTGMDLLKQLSKKNGKCFRQLETNKIIQKLKSKFKQALNILLEHVWTLQNENIRTKSIIRETIADMRYQSKKSESQIKDILWKMMKTLSGKIEDISNLATQNLQLKRQLKISRQANEKMQQKIKESQLIILSQTNKIQSQKRLAPKDLIQMRRVLMPHPQLSKSKDKDSQKELARSYSVHTRYTNSFKDSLHISKEQHEKDRRKSSNMNNLQVESGQESRKMDLSCKTQQLEKVNEEGQISRRASILLGQQKMESVIRREKFKKYINQKNINQKGKRKEATKAQEVQPIHPKIAVYQSPALKSKLVRTTTIYNHYASSAALHSQIPDNEQQPNIKGKPLKGTQANHNY